MSDVINKNNVHEIGVREFGVDWLRVNEHTCSELEKSIIGFKRSQYATILPMALLFAMRQIETINNARARMIQETLDANSKTRK